MGWICTFLLIHQVLLNQIVKREPLTRFMEYIPGGSIADLLLRHEKLADEVNKSFLGQILNGVGYLHSKGIIHQVRPLALTRTASKKLNASGRT